MKSLEIKNCTLITHAVRKSINIKLIKNDGSRELSHDVLFSQENFHKGGALLLIINSM